MICKECKDCLNYLVSEVGCWGSKEPCEYLETDNQYQTVVLKDKWIG